MGGTLPSFYDYPGILLRIQRRFSYRFFAVEAYRITPHIYFCDSSVLDDHYVIFYGRCYVDIVVVVLLAAAQVSGAHRRWIALV